MILFNLSFYNPILHSFDKNDLCTRLQFTKSVYIYIVRNNFNLNKSKYNKSSCFVSSNNNILVNQLTFKSASKNSKAKIIKRNFWQKLVNKYWQETIFISSSNSLLNNYTNKLKSTGLSVYEGSDYKNFLLQFSKDLLDRKIHFNFKNLNNGKIFEAVNKNNVYIKYKWLKFFNPNTMLMQYSSNEVNTYKYTDSFNYSLPLFTLVNSNKQIILAESSDELSNRQVLLKFYHKLTNKGLYNKKLYTGLFFINPEDATEYQNYIINKYSKSTRNIQVKLVVTTLNFYNKILSKSSNATEFRLIPDLQEVGNLLFKYRKYKNLEFDLTQKYGHNYFQGQPIYIIKSLKTSNNLDNIKYSYSYYGHNNQKTQYNPIFLNHETAVNAWQTYKKSLNAYYLPIKPSLYVSNLETFINTSNYIKNQDRFIFLPSLDTFQFIKRYLQNGFKNSNNILKVLRENSLNLKSLCYRTLWSLTTRQPNNIW
uniref:Ycf80 n=1 Tax=Chondria sp. (in: red algae) TaxID=1982705 RepID=A0A1Z1MCM6_9FLOR|nr:hypothetical protein [Chondria sp. (in: red algae)]